MFKTLLSSKIHRVTITQADLNYVGSITIDSELIAAAGLVEGEQVHIVDVNNGARFITYVISGTPGSGVICVNGAAARLVQTGDIAIVIGYAMVDADEIATHRPKVVHVDGANRLIGTSDDPTVLMHELDELDELQAQYRGMPS